MIIDNNTCHSTSYQHVDLSVIIENLLTEQAKLEQDFAKICRLMLRVLQENQETNNNKTAEAQKNTRTFSKGLAGAASTLAASVAAGMVGFTKVPNPKTVAAAIQGVGQATTQGIGASSDNEKQVRDSTLTGYNYQSEFLRNKYNDLNELIRNAERQEEKDLSKIDEVRNREDRLFS